MVESLEQYLVTEIGSQMMLSDKIVTAYTDRDSSIRARTVTMIVQALSQEYATVSYPGDWWQSFKFRWFPNILQRRFPVEWTDHVCVRYCPHLLDLEPEKHLGFMRNGT